MVSNAMLGHYLLTDDLSEHGLVRGDIGTVVLLHDLGGYEVEFMTLDGETIAIVSLKPEQVRSVGRDCMRHLRFLDHREQPRSDSDGEAIGLFQLHSALQANQLCTS